MASGSRVKPGEMLIEAYGRTGGLHNAWKVSLNILEYCSVIATRTRNLVDLAQKENPDVEVVATRKSFPGTKELSIKAIIAGGTLPNRLGLSETILIIQL